MPKLTEKIVEIRLAAHYRSKDYIVLRQASFSRKKIDLVTKGKNDQEIIAIEIKLRDWQGGLRQASVNSVACDKSYVAIWHEYASPALNNRTFFEDLGIGLIVIDETYAPKVEFEPNKNSPSQVVRDYFFAANFQIA